MINKNAYTYDIVPNGGGSGENNSVHQTNPSWVLTFLSWKVLDTLRTAPTTTENTTIDYSTIINPPLIIDSDCIQLGVADAKSVLTPSMSATLMATDINYATAINPGDFVFVNMLNWQSEADEIVRKARALEPINGIKDGFKGFFKIQSVRESLQVDPGSGTKTYSVKITAFAFTEFNNSIFFNPNMINGTTDQNLEIFLTNLGSDFDKINTNKAPLKLEEMMKFLIKSFIGEGFPDNNKKGEPLSKNVHFYMPPGVSKLLGLPELKSAKDAYNYLLGIQQYDSGNYPTIPMNQGMNPKGIGEDATNTSRFIFTGNSLQGQTTIKPSYWNNVKTWSILNQFVNSPINELYSCFRVSPNGSVLPTVVFRQMPFTSDNFNALTSSRTIESTPFTSIPRWNIDPALAFGYDLGKDDVLRVNYLQMYGKSSSDPNVGPEAEEIAAGNYVYDIDDVKRNGLRPIVYTSEFDLANKAEFLSPSWAKLMADASMGGHLKSSGQISFVGIVEPIAVGDNLQFNNTVFHIEQISHNASIGRDGSKNFRTNITVSYGIDINSDKNITVYPQSTLSKGQDSRESDYNNQALLPGVSESKDTYYRSNSPDSPQSPIESPASTTTGVDANLTVRKP